MDKVFLFGVENVLQNFKILIFKWVNYMRCEVYLGNVSVLKMQEVGWGASSVGEDLGLVPREAGHEDTLL